MRGGWGVGGDVVTRMATVLLTLACLLQFQAPAWGGSGAAASLEQRVSQRAQTRGERVISVAQETAIGRDLVIPADVVLKVAAGGFFSGAGKLRIEGKLEAGRSHIFRGTGQVTLAPGSAPAVYPQWWGARGNGKNDDSAALQAAVAQRGKVFIPKTGDSYLLNGLHPLLLHSGSRIESDGATLKLLGMNYDKRPCFFSTTAQINGGYDAAVPVTEGVVIRGINLDGNIEQVSGQPCTGINAYKVSKLSVEEVGIRNLSGEVGGGYGIVVWYSNGATLKRIRVDRTDRQNICIWETLDAKISDCDLNNSYFRDCILVSTNTPPSFQSSHATIENCRMKNTGEKGTHVVRFSGAGSGVLRNCRLEGNSRIDGVYITDKLPKTVLVANNTITSASYGVRLESKSDSRITIEGNRIERCTDGIRAASAVSEVTVRGNEISGSTGQPLYFAYAARKVIDGNRIEGGSKPVALWAEAGTSLSFTNNTITAIATEQAPVQLFHSDRAGLSQSGNRFPGDRRKIQIMQRKI